MAKLSTLIVLFFWFFTTNAQTPTYYTIGTGTGGNTIPLNQASQETQILYAPTDFNTAPIPGYISKIYFKNSSAGTTVIYNDFQISFLQTTDVAFPATSFYTGVQNVLPVSSCSVTGNAVANGWFEINVPPIFLYDNTKSLVVEIQYTAKTGGISTTTTASNNRNTRFSGTSLSATTGTTNTIQNIF